MVLTQTHLSSPFFNGSLTETFNNPLPPVNVTTKLNKAYAPFPNRVRTENLGGNSFPQTGATRTPFPPVKVAPPLDRAPSLNGGLSKTLGNPLPPLNMTAALDKVYAPSPDGGPTVILDNPFQPLLAALFAFLGVAYTPDFCMPFLATVIYNDVPVPHMALVHAGLAAAGSQSLQRHQLAPFDERYTIFHVPDGTGNSVEHGFLVLPNVIPPFAVSDSNAFRLKIKTTEVSGRTTKVLNVDVYGDPPNLSVDACYQLGVSMSPALIGDRKGKAPTRPPPGFTSPMLAPTTPASPRGLTAAAPSLPATPGPQSQRPPGTSRPPSARVPTLPIGVSSDEEVVHDAASQHDSSSDGSQESDDEPTPVNTQRRQTLPTLTGEMGQSTENVTQNIRSNTHPATANVTPNVSTVYRGMSTAVSIGLPVDPDNWSKNPDFSDVFIWRRDIPGIYDTVLYNGLRAMTKSHFVATFQCEGRTVQYHRARVTQIPLRAGLTLELLIFRKDKRLPEPSAKRTIRRKVHHGSWQWLLNVFNGTDNTESYLEWKKLLKDWVTYISYLQSYKSLRKSADQRGRQSLSAAPVAVF